VATEGWVVAGFAHRTSREGDPQLHTHCLVPNLVRRTVDGAFVALDGGPVRDWCRAAGSIYQNELQRLLSLRLGVRWGPDRHNTREMVGFTLAQLRVFSKRSAQIERELERVGAGYESPALRMQADDAASLATRPAKDHALTPALLADRWRRETAEVGLSMGRELDRAVCFAEADLAPPSWEEVVAALVDEEAGLCGRDARFTEADVVEHVCAVSGGRLTAGQIFEAVGRFLSSELAVRLTSGVEPGRRRCPPQWSTAAHRALEDASVALLDDLAGRVATPVTPAASASALSGVGGLGDDQVEAVRALCGQGGSLRAVLAPAGFGKTALARAAAGAAGGDGRRVMAVATTAKAVAELAEAGLDACTLARFRLDLGEGGLAPGTVVLLDEISQTPTRDAHTVLAAVAACPDGMLWVLGDARQSQPVAAGGMADEIERRVAAGTIPTGRLAVNRRQLDPVDREALGLLRRGGAAPSQRLRQDQGWEHEHANPGVTREAMAEAVWKSVALHGADQVAAMAVSHADAEDVADRIRARLAAGGVVTGAALVGPGWSADRCYQAGDRILVHARCGGRDSRLINGTTATVEHVDEGGLAVRLDGGSRALLPTRFVQGARRDGTPNLSHGWCRTVDGAQGGTWVVCHLLGTSALDAFRGYTGQSRSRQPTHTWNTARVAAVDHGGLLAERRSPAAQVADALARRPDARLAARSDPYDVERQVVAQIRVHRAVLARQPPDRAAAVVGAEAELARLRARHTELKVAADSSRERVEGLGRLGGLGRKGRVERCAWQGQLDAEPDAAGTARAAVAAATVRLGQLRGAQAAHDRFVSDEGWRRDAIIDLQRRLERHWRDVILDCIRADDPLAFGIDRLRQARRSVAAELDDLASAAPDDRDVERAQARRQLVEATSVRQEAERELSQARDRLERAGERRRDRRDHHAMAPPAAELAWQEQRVREAADRERAARRRSGELDEHQRRRRQALAVTGKRHEEATNSLRDIDDALDQTRHERTEALAVDPPDYLRRLIGRVPSSDTGRSLWVSLAEKAETTLDRHEPDSVAWHEFCGDLRAARAEAARWRASRSASRPSRQRLLASWDYPCGRAVPERRGPQTGL
jgi:hypothetical protein